MRISIALRPSSKTSKESIKRKSRKRIESDLGNQNTNPFFKVRHLLTSGIVQAIIFFKAIVLFFIFLGYHEEASLPHLMVVPLKYFKVRKKAQMNDIT